jgi:glutathione peroxidase
VDLLGKTAHPLYLYLMSALKNPNGRAAVSLNFEKFLLDETGQPVRRYPRKFDGYQVCKKRRQKKC